MEWYFGAILYTMLCLLYMFLGMNSDKKPLKLVLKGAPIVFLIVTVGKEIFQRSAPVTFSAPGSSKQLSTLFWGLVFTCIGDGYLIFESFFLYGVLSFAVAQAIFISLFDGSVSLLFDPTRNDIISGLAIVVVSTLLLAYIWPKLNRALVVPVAMYCCVISFMLWSAVVKMLHKPTDLTVLGAIGALMFYTSDLLLGVHKWRLQIPFAQVFIMTTYYTAQLFIARSVLGID